MNTLEEVLPAKFFEVLERSDICTPKQIMILSVWDIKKKTNLSNDDVVFLKNIVSSHLIPSCETCDVLLEKENKHKSISTGCKAFDKILKGGFRRGTLSEIFGKSGSGKTQIVIQAAAYNWTHGTVYICTEDLFPVKRYEQIQQNLPNFNPKLDYGANNYIEHITESQDLISCIRVRLSKLLSKHKISLIVIDSLAAPFRVDNTNYMKRAEELRELAITLIKIAQERNLAVVCINQVTASFNERVDVLPALGLAWSNMICTRLWLKKTNQMWRSPDSSLKNLEIGSNNASVFVRELSVEFSSYLPYSRAKCVITSSGVLGI